MSRKRKVDRQFAEMTEDAVDQPSGSLVVTVDFVALLEKHDSDLTAVFAVLCDLKDLLR